MSIKITFHPLDGWPEEFTKRREKSPFKVTYSATLGELERELRIIGARGVCIYLDVGPGAIRNDGLLRADARPGHPGVMLTWHFWDTDPNDPVRIYDDQYDHWHANLRGIVLSMEALRGVDRWGATKRKQQYTGFQKLAKVAPAQTPLVKRETELFGSPLEAVRYLAFVAQSMHWAVDMGNEAALSQAMELAKQNVQSPAQLRLVEAAIDIIQKQ